MNHSIIRSAWRAGWVLAIVLGGCSGGADDGLPRQPVAGTVTLDGRPLARGTIQFLPTSQTGGTPALVEIEDGRYAIARERGLVPGPYRVLISSTASAPSAKGDDLPGMTGPPPKELLPPRYNAGSTLAAEIKEGESNSFDFPLKTK